MKSFLNIPRFSVTAVAVYQIFLVITVVCGNDLETSMEATADNPQLRGTDGDGIFNRSQQEGFFFHNHDTGLSYNNTDGGYLVDQSVGNYAFNQQQGAFPLNYTETLGDGNQNKTTLRSQNQAYSVFNDVSELRNMSLSFSQTKSSFISSHQSGSIGPNSSGNMMPSPKFQFQPGSSNPFANMFGNLNMPNKAFLMQKFSPMNQHSPVQEVSLTTPSTEPSETTVPLTTPSTEPSETTVPLTTPSTESSETTVSVTTTSTEPSETTVSLTTTSTEPSETTVSPPQQDQQKDVAKSSEELIYPDPEGPSEDDFMGPHMNRSSGSGPTHRHSSEEYTTGGILTDYPEETNEDGSEGELKGRFLYSKIKKIARKIMKK